MRKTILIFSLIAGTFILAKCTPKASKTITETTTPAPPEVATAPTAPVLAPTYSADQIASGKTIYTNTCGKCHKLYSTTEFTATQWAPILKGMIPKAKLSDTDAALVKAFVYSNAKQG